MVWWSIDMVCTLGFTVELCMRFMVCDVYGLSWFQFVRHPLNVFDFIALLPWYLETLFSGLGGETVRVLKVVRLARVLRLLKVARYSTGLQTMVEGLQRSLQALFLLAGAVLLGMVLSSSMIYYAEKDANPDPAQFASIPASFWWAIVTMTTVGYGGVVPVSTPGKLIAAFTMLFGILLIALPMAIVGNKFQEVYVEMMTLKVNQLELGSLKGVGPLTKKYMEERKAEAKGRRRTVSGEDSPIRTGRTPRKDSSPTGNLTDLGAKGDGDLPAGLSEDLKDYVGLQVEMCTAMRATFALASSLPTLSTSVLQTIPIDTSVDGTGGTAEGAEVLAPPIPKK